MRLLTPAWLLRIESLVLLAVALALYGRHGGSWLLFAVLILAPDLSMIGYAANNRFGARMYNLAHAFIVPGALIAIGVASSDLALSIGLIWGAHIAADRVVGYGLKYDDDFKSTHLRRV